MKKDKTTWRLFERFVADIEKLFFTKPSVKVTSPDTLPDIDGGNREVDCSIRFKENGIDKLIIIECRDRKGSADVRWIEEIRTKVESVRADKAIVVHRRHMSMTALRKARRYGIEVRRLAKLESEEDQGIMPSLKFVRPKFKLNGVKLDFAEGKNHESLVRESIQDPSNHVIRDLAKNRTWSFEQLCQNAIDSGFAIPHSDLLCEELEVVFCRDSKPQLNLITAKGELPIETLTLKVEVTRAIIDVNKHEVARYTSSEFPEALDFGQVSIDGISKIITGVSTLEKSTDKSTGDISVTLSILFEEGVNFDEIWKARGN
jgi:Restriction endonuclease